LYDRYDLVQTLFEDLIIDISQLCLHECF